MYSLAYSLLKDEEEAHDVVHEVFSTILYSKDEEEYGAGFLIRCVRNQCLNIIRRMPVRESIRRHLIIEGESEIHDSRYSMEMLDEIHDMILHELPEQCSKVMRLRYEEGWSYMDIAAGLSISKVTVYKHLKNGIDYLRKNIKRLES